MNYEEYVNKISSGEIDGARKGRAKTMRPKSGYIALDDLLQKNPAIVAQKDFIKGIIAKVIEDAKALHARDEYHICYSPKCIFVKKTTRIDPYSAILTEPELLEDDPLGFAICNPDILYRGMEEYIAPEVMAGEHINAKTDIYSIGRLMEYLYASTSKPIGYGRIIRKATEELSFERYETLEDMEAAMENTKRTVSGVAMFAVAVVVALAIVGIFFIATPEPTQAEYIQPSPEEALELMLKQGDDPTTELGYDPETAQTEAEQEAEMSVYNAKLEQIFRRRYMKEADRILSKVYDAGYMSTGEKVSVSATNSISEELLSAQKSIAEEVGLDELHSTSIATDIINTLTEQKNAELQRKAVQKETK